MDTLIINKNKKNFIILLILIFISILAFSAEKLDEGYKDYKKGISFINSKDYKSALKQFQIALTKAPSNPQYHKAIANCYLNLLDYSNALIYLKNADNLKPDDEWVNSSLAIVYSSDEYKMYNEALYSVNKALSIDPEKSEYLEIKANILEKMNKKPLSKDLIDEIEAIYLKIIDSKSGNEKFYKNILNLYFDSNIYDKKIDRYFEIYILNYYNDIDIYLKYADYKFNLGDLNTAEIYYKQGYNLCRGDSLEKIFLNKLSMLKPKYYRLNISFLYPSAIKANYILLPQNFINNKFLTYKLLNVTNGNLVTYNGKKYIKIDNTNGKIELNYLIKITHLPIMNTSEDKNFLKNLNYEEYYKIDNNYIKGRFNNNLNIDSTLSFNYLINEIMDKSLKIKNLVEDKIYFLEIKDFTFVDFLVNTYRYYKIPCKKYYVYKIDSEKIEEAIVIPVNEKNFIPLFINEENYKNNIYPENIILLNDNNGYKYIFFDEDEKEYSIPWYLMTIKGENIVDTLNLGKVDIFENNPNSEIVFKKKKGYIGKIFLFLLIIFLLSSPILIYILKDKKQFTFLQKLLSYLPKIEFKENIVKEKNKEKKNKVEDNKKVSEEILLKNLKKIFLKNFKKDIIHQVELSIMKTNFKEFMIVPYSYITKKKEENETLYLIIGLKNKILSAIIKEIEDNNLIITILTGKNFYKFIENEDKIKIFHKKDEEWQYTGYYDKNEKVINNKIEEKLYFIQKEEKIYFIKKFSDEENIVAEFNEKFGKLKDYEIDLQYLLCPFFYNFFKILE